MSSITDICMQMLLGNQAPDRLAAMGNLSDRLTRIAESDPRLAPLAQRLQERLTGGAANSTTESEDLADPEILEPPNEERTAKLEKAARKMHSELKAIRTRNGMLAEALGACPNCWGDDHECAYCSGQGAIGSFLIDPKVFHDVVGPAVQQVRQRSPLVKSQTARKGEENHA